MSSEQPYRPRGLQILVELQETLVRLQRIEVLSKLLRAKQQFEFEKLLAERAQNGVEVSSNP